MNRRLFLRSLGAVATALAIPLPALAGDGIPDHSVVGDNFANKHGGEIEIWCDGEQMQNVTTEFHRSEGWIGHYEYTKTASGYYQIADPGNRASTLIVKRFGRVVVKWKRPDPDLGSINPSSWPLNA